MSAPCIRSLNSTLNLLKETGHVLLMRRINSCSSITGVLYQKTDFQLAAEDVRFGEKVKFSRLRARDNTNAQLSTIVDESLDYNLEDTHSNKYDLTNSVDLSSATEGNVPSPFSVNAEELLLQYKQEYFNNDKYVSGDLHDYHATRTGRGITSFLYNDSSINKMFPLNHQSRAVGSDLQFSIRKHHLCTYFLPCFPYTNLPCRRNLNISHIACHEVQGLSSRQKLKRAVKEYGATVIVFHVFISLVSLSVCYIIVKRTEHAYIFLNSSNLIIVPLCKHKDHFGFVGKSFSGASSEGVSATTVVCELSFLQLCSGVDVSGLLTKLGVDLSALGSNADSIQDKESTAASVDSVVTGVSTFVVAYAFHKIFAPVRIAVTLSVSPFIVRHLRRTGFLKPPRS